MNGQRYVEFKVSEDSVVVLESRDPSNQNDPTIFSVGSNYEDFFFSITKIEKVHQEAEMVLKMYIKGSAFLVSENIEISVYSSQEKDNLIGLIFFKNGKVMSHGMKITEQW